MKRSVSILILTMVLLSAAAGYTAQEFRGLDRIPTPSAAASEAAALTEQGYQPVGGAQALSPALVEKVVYDLFDSWNTPDLGSKLTRDITDAKGVALQTMPDILNMDGFYAAVMRRKA